MDSTLSNPFDNSLPTCFPLSTTNGSSKPLLLEETRCRNYYHSNAKEPIINNLISFEEKTHEQIMKTVKKQLEEMYMMTGDIENAHQENYDDLTVY